MSSILRNRKDCRASIQKNSKSPPPKKKIWPNIVVGRLVAKSSFFLVFFFFLKFFVFFYLVGFFIFFRNFSEILRNGRFLIGSRMWSIISGFFSEIRLFAAPIRSASLNGLHKILLANE